MLRERFADDAQFVARFHREARAAAALNHPNVVAIHDRGGAAGSSFIVMEYVAGETVKELCSAPGRSRRPRPATSSASCSRPCRRPTSAASCIAT